MTQAKDLEFVTKETLKNGSFKLQFIEREVYGILRSLGYRFVRIERKPFLYHIDSRLGIRLLRQFQELRDAFAEYIGQLDLPTKEHDEILNTFYAKSPIKRNASIERYLTDSPEPSYYLIQEIKMQRTKD
jgi:hypothetical protein